MVRVMRPRPKRSMTNPSIVDPEISLGLAISSPPKQSIGKIVREAGSPDFGCRRFDVIWNTMVR
jgi:hypothetical protein